MAIHLTESAAAHIQAALKQKGNGVGLRLKIKLSGCSGYAYEADYADSVGPEDQVFESFGAKVIIDQKSLALVDGTVVDFQAKGLNKIFVFQNPQADAWCGCGESFSLKK